MSSSRKKQLQLTVSLLGQYWGEHLLKKLENEIPNIRNCSDATIRECIYKIINYIDNVKNSDYSMIDSYSIIEFETLWSDWITEYKNQYSNKNYIETNKIILKHNNGFYWIKNNSFYSAEMIIRLNNCGRISPQHHFLELRETQNEYNYTHIVVVIDNNGITHQIQGKNNEKPNKIYFQYIYELLINTNIINTILSKYPTKNEFRLTDFDIESINILKKTKPNLFKLL